MDKMPDAAERLTNRWTLIRDVAVLQVKLMVDGLRDLVLVPASLLAGIMSLLSGTDGRPGEQFYRLIGLGKRSERWINLFGALENAPAKIAEKAHAGDADIDRLVSHLETYLVDEYARGGVTAQAKKRIDRVLDSFGRRPRNAE